MTGNPKSEGRNLNKFRMTLTMKTLFKQLPRMLMAFAALTPLVGAPILAAVSGDDSPEAAWQRECGGTHEQRMKWWREARVGMFIHWGVYSVPAGVWKGEQSKHIG